jgi:hypothetical protein
MLRAIRITSWIAVLVLLLAGAAAAAAPHLNNAAGPAIVSELDNGLLEAIAVSVETEPAAEMPDVPTDVAGVFVRLDDDSLFAGTGNSASLKKGDTWELHHDGPIVEVITTEETRLFQDDTVLQRDGVAPSGAVKQTLRVGDLSRIGPNSAVSAWGEKHGSSFVADVIIYTNQ